MQTKATKKQPNNNYRKYFCSYFAFVTRKTTIFVGIVRNTNKSE
jgi:hypothetical protein